MQSALQGRQLGLICKACPREQRCIEYPIAGVDDLRQRVMRDMDWGGRCPVSWLGSEAVLWASELWAQSRVSPLAGWPDDYSPAVVSAVVALHAAHEAAIQEAMRR